MLYNSQIKFFLILFLFYSCNSTQNRNEHVSPDSSLNQNKQGPLAESKKDSVKPENIYSNQRFKEVSITQTGDHTFEINGRAQVFEAAFSWIIEDGHEELQKGFQMTNAGAPEWGEFNFTVTAKKKRYNSTLTLILFEASAKDGSRQYELPIKLY